MNSLEPKKLALIRIYQILKEHSDIDHPMTQENIANHLENDYGIVIERKAISRNISLLKEAGVEIESVRAGSYLAYRDFMNSELHMLIDGVLNSKYITASHSKDLINRLSRLSNKYFKSRVRHTCSVNEWSKTDNQSVFYNIGVIDAAKEKGVLIHYDYNKYGIDKKMHKSSEHSVSPYQLILHNQRYYLMAYSEQLGKMVFHRLDHITNMTLTDKSATPLKNIEGYENGINYKNLSSMPYMYSDAPQNIDFVADSVIIDHIIDWFGTDIKIDEIDDDKVMVSIKASPTAMAYWALQYINHVEVISPKSLQESIKESLESGLKKYIQISTAPRLMCNARTMV